MKKISVFLLLAATVISLSSMEMQRPKSKQKKIEHISKQLEIKQPEIKPIRLSLNPLFPNDIFTVTNPKPIHHTKQPEHVQTMHPVWLPMDGAMQASYHGEQTRTCSSVELQPVYKQTNKPTDQEKQSLLRTNSLKPDKNIMESLHKKAANIYAHNIYISELNDRSRYGQKSQHRKLVRLINHMNNVRNNGIHEDIMGQFAYNKKTLLIYHGNEIDLSLFYSLFFILLKKYNLTVHETGEQLPLHFDIKKTCLKEVLTISPHTSQQPNTNNDLITYPAFFQFFYDLRHAFQELPLESIQTFLAYVYENNNILVQNYSQSTYADLKNEFYAKAYNLLLHNGSIQGLYDLIKMIDTAKKKKDINNEDDLAKGIIGFEPNQPLKALFFSLVDDNHSVENVKKHIALFCTLAQQYNNARGTKTTPTVTQHHINLVQENLNIPTDSPFFDKNLYALPEFAQLVKKTELLKAADEEEIDEEFKRYYLQQK